MGKDPSLHVFSRAKVGKGRGAARRPQGTSQARRRQGALQSDSEREREKARERATTSNARVFMSKSGQGPMFARVFTNKSGQGPRFARVFTSKSGQGPRFARVFTSKSGQGPSIGTGQEAKLLQNASVEGTTGPFQLPKPGKADPQASGENFFVKTRANLGPCHFCL